MHQHLEPCGREGRGHEGGKEVVLEDAPGEGDRAHTGPLRQDDRPPHQPGGQRPVERCGDLTTRSACQPPCKCVGDQRRRVEHPRVGVGRTNPVVSHVRGTGRSDVGDRRRLELGRSLSLVAGDAAATGQGGDGIEQAPTLVV